MSDYEINIDFNKEFKFLTSKSSGPGGQHVNKTNTKVELRFDIVNSLILTNEEKDTLLEKLASMVSKDGILSITSQNSRSQLQNKENAIKKFYKLVAKALTPPKERKSTVTPKISIEKRLSDKQKLAEKKKLRKDDVVE